MITVPKGTVENMVVYVHDAYSTITDLTDTDPQFGVCPEYDEVTSYTSCAPGPEPMTLLCLVDTGPLERRRYDLYVKLTNLPEQPVVGPMPFKVE